MKKDNLLKGLLLTTTLLTLSGCGTSGKANEEKGSSSSKTEQTSESVTKENTSTSSTEKTTTTNSSEKSDESDNKISLGGEKTPRDNNFPTPSGPATFTRTELTPSSTGWIRYGALSGGRATAANAVIVKSMIGTGTTADPNLRPAGFISGQAPYGHARGHLIGRQLGGSGRTMQNLVTLYQNPVNTPYMTRYENIVRNAAESGNQVRYRVTPNYKRGQEMPASVTMEARTIGNNTVNFKVVIPNER